MLTRKDIQEQIETAISQLSFDVPPRSLFAPISYTLSLGGKRIRPVLTLMACNLFSETVEKALPAMLGVEIFHNFTLLHDDLMDAASMRRNQPTVHKKWSPNAAILSGDAMLVVAYQHIAKTDARWLKSVLDTFSTTAVEVCAGQQYDMEFESRMDVSEEEYIEMIRLKTAVLLACALKMGAIVGGATEEDATHLYDFGIRIGLAFQVQDDLLDVYGDPKTFGKQIGGDILCNKKTFLLVNALKHANEEQAGRLNTWIGQTEAVDPQRKIEGVTLLYNEIGVKEIAEKKIADYYALAMESLNALSVSAERTAELRLLAEKMMHRQS